MKTSLAFAIFLWFQFVACFGHAEDANAREGVAQQPLPERRLTLSVGRTAQGREVSVRDVAFSPDGKQLAVATSDKCVKLFRLPDGQQQDRIDGQGREVWCVGYSPEGGVLFCGGAEPPFWDVVRGEAKTMPKIPSFAYAVDFSPDGKMLATGQGRTEFKVWDLKSGELLKTFDPYAGAGNLDSGLYNTSVFTIDFSPDGRLVAVHTDFFDDELPQLDRIQVWELESGRLVASFAGAQCAFWRRGGMIGYVDEGKVKLRNLRTLQVETTLAGASPIQRAAFSPDGRTVAAVAKDESVQIWDAPTRKLLTTLPGQGRRFAVPTFSPDGKLLAVGNVDGTIGIWQLKPAADAAR